MKILLTGTTGFVGSHLGISTAKIDHDVYGLERYMSGHYLPKSRKQLKTVFANLNDHFAVRNLIKDIQPEVIIHLAALTPVAYSYDRPQETLETNFWRQ